MFILMNYFLLMSTYALVGALCYCIIRGIVAKAKRKKLSWRNELPRVLFTGYCTGLASQTIFPNWEAGFDSAHKFYFHVNIPHGKPMFNLIPFQTILPQLRGENLGVDAADVPAMMIVNLLGNIVVFMPFGILLPMVFPKLRRTPWMLLSGFLLTCFIETMQLFIGRSFDVDDLLFNVIGVMLGYFLYCLNSKMSKKRSAENN